jgi:hypothetical protein
MRKLVTATLGAALLAAMSAAHAIGSTKVPIDPTVTSTNRSQNASGASTKPRDTNTGTQPVQKPAGAGGTSRTPQR